MTGGGQLVAGSGQLVAGSGILVTGCGHFVTVTGRDQLPYYAIKLTRLQTSSREQQRT